jgi:ethanolamine ammonia-lyase small subunit
MGCGCKNKGNQTPAPATQTTAQQTAQPTAVTEESVKSSIKKTIEKYYNVNKTSSTNGWIKG